MTSMLIGRDAELAHLRELLRAAADSLRCLVLEGEPGVGKTAIWEAGLEMASERGWRILVARCRESETQLAFAALGDLLADSHAVLVELPRPQRRALEAALLLAEDDGASGDPRAIGLACLTSLRLLAASSPLFIAIDDLQWLDASSAAALGFALARIRDERVGVLATARTTAEMAELEIEEAVDPDRLTRIVVGPLRLAGTYELLRTRIGLQLSRPLLTRFHSASQGNPLFTLEIGRLIAQLGRELTAGEDFPVPKSVERAVESRLATFDEATREALLTVALAAEPTYELVDAVVGDSRQMLAPAVEADVVVVESRQLRFAHPLFAAAVRVAAAPPAQRAIHSKLAVVVSNPEEQARHRARALTNPDTAVAAALAHAAEDARRRGAPDAAADLFEEAVRLSPDSDDRARLVVQAAAAYNDALDSVRAASLIEGLLPSLAGGPLRARAILELLRSESTAVSDELVREALQHAHDDAHLRAEILSCAAEFAEIERGVIAATKIALEAVREAELTDDGGLIAETLAYAGHLATLSDPGDAGLSLLSRARELHQRDDRISGWRSPTHWIGVRLMWEDRLDEARDLLEEQLRVADEEGDGHSQTGLCFHLTQLETRAGMAGRALAFAEEAWEIDAPSRRVQSRAVSLYALALAHANFGDEKLARAAFGETLETFERIPDLFFTTHVRSALVQLALSLDDPREAIVALGDARALREATQVGEPGIFPFDADEIETLIGVGRVDEADALAHELLGLGRTLNRSRLVATGLRSLALIAAAEGDLTSAEGLVVEALQEHERLPVPLERGRTLLAFGTVLRRAQQKRAARETLEEAAALFASIGTPRWEQRARTEAARIGGRSAPRGLLTTMEQKVAELAAAGRTNAEIADELHVSPRTVQWNLSKVYKKLEVRSRTELASVDLQPRR